MQRSTEINISTGSFGFDVNRDSNSYQSPGKCCHGLRAGENPLISLKEQIGEGANSIVYKAICQRGCKIRIAVKKINTRRTVEMVNHEIKYLKLAFKHKHPNIIEYFGHYFMDGAHHLVFEQGDVNFRYYLHDNTSKMNVAHFHNFVYQSLEMLYYLTVNKIVHGDFFTENMMYFRNSDTIKLCDFGRARYKDKPDVWNDLKRLVACFYFVQLDIRLCSKNKPSRKLDIMKHPNLDSILSDKYHWLEGLSEPTIQALCIHHRIALSGDYRNDYARYAYTEPGGYAGYIGYSGSQAQTEDAQKVLSSRGGLLPRQALNDLESN